MGKGLGPQLTFCVIARQFAVDWPRKAAVKIVCLYFSTSRGMWSRCSLARLDFANRLSIFVTMRHCSASGAILMGASEKRPLLMTKQVVADELSSSHDRIVRLQ